MVSTDADVRFSDNVVINNSEVGVDLNENVIVRLERNLISGNGDQIEDFTGGLRIRVDDKRERVTLSGDRIVDNGSHGVLILDREGDSVAVLSADPANPTQIFGNAGSQVFNRADFEFGENPEDDGNVDASNVFWNTVTPEAIEDAILDFFDDASKGIVFSEPFFEPIFGDTNIDGVVDAGDLNALALNCQQGVGGWVDADFSGDGIVDSIDLNLLALNWQEGVEDPALRGFVETLAVAVPEPGAIGLWAAGVASVFLGCRAGRS